MLRFSIFHITLLNFLLSPYLPQLSLLQHQSSSSSSLCRGRCPLVGLCPTPGRGWPTTGSWRVPRPAATASSSPAQPGIGVGRVRRVGRGGRGSVDGIIPGGGRNSPKDLCEGLWLSLGKLMLSSAEARIPVVAEDKYPGAVGDRLILIGLNWSIFRLDGCWGVGGSRRRGGGGRRTADMFGSVALRR